MYFGRVWITQKEGREDLVRPEQIEPRKLKDRQRKQTGKDMKKNRARVFNSKRVRIVLKNTDLILLGKQKFT